MTFLIHNTKTHSIELLYFDSFVVKVGTAVLYTYTNMIIKGIWSKYWGKIRAFVPYEKYVAKKTGLKWKKSSWNSTILTQNISHI